MATNFLGVDGKVTTYGTLLELINRKVKIKGMIDDMVIRRVPSTFKDELNEIKVIDERLYSVENAYKLRDIHGQTCSADMEDLDAMGDLYDTNWSVLVGIDRADPLKKDRTSARTIVTVLAKGLPGSRSNPQAVDNGNPQYMYVVLNIAHIATSLLQGIKDVILEAHGTYDGIDAVCGERWGIWDMAPWCEEHSIRFEPIHPSYDKQKAAFSEMHGAVSTGRFKLPPLVVWGSKGEDIFKEEAGIFFHDEDKRWFGSPEKMEKYGTQDDCMFSLAWGIYGGRDFKLDDFKERKGVTFFGTFVRNTSLLTKH